MSQLESQPPTATAKGGSPITQSSPSGNLIWGKLHSTSVLKSVDLTKKILVGRAEQCDVVITSNNFPLNKVHTISKVHFMISYDETKKVAWLEDFSKNGTYVNKKIVGKGKRVVLQNRDIIGVSNELDTVYIYLVFEQDNYLPSGLREKYVVARTLGKGSCGEVTLVYKKDSLEEFAVKKIIKSNVQLKNNLNTPERVQNEIKILQFLSHPCIIQTKEIVELDDSVFIVMKYMKGGDLGTHMNAAVDPLSEKVAKLIFYQLAVGIEYLHTEGITHRDIKPQNVLLKSNNLEDGVKIADFGLSKMLQSTLYMSTLCGTLAYVAPEVLDSKCTKYTQAVDIWSLGVLLYYLLSRQLPFSGDEMRLKFLIVSVRYHMRDIVWNTISKEAKDLIKKMLVKDPNKRLKLFEILQHPWIAEDREMLQIADKLLADDTEHFTPPPKMPRRY